MQNIALGFVALVLGYAAMPSLVRSACWRCWLPNPTPGERRGVRSLSDIFEFVHVVEADTGVTHCFVQDNRKPVLSTFVGLVERGRWRPVLGGVAQVMWDIRGRHRVYGKEPRPGSRTDLDAPDNLLNARLLLAGDPASLRVMDKGVELVELWAGFGQVSVAVSRLGRRAVRIGYAHGQDFARAADRDGVERLLDRARPGTLLCAPQCRDFSSWQEVNCSRFDGFEAALRHRRSRQLTILNWMVQLLLAQLARGGDIVVEQPRQSRMWRLACIRHLLRRARLAGFALRFVDLDQCAYGLADPCSRRKFKKATRFLVSNSRLSALARKCSCRKPHELLAGYTLVRGHRVCKTRFAECYSRALAGALAGAIVP